MSACELCATNTGRTNGKLECCQLRDLAQAPRHQQEAFAKSLTATEREELRPRLSAEIKRLRGLKQLNRSGK